MNSPSLRTFAAMSLFVMVATAANAQGTSDPTITSPSPIDRATVKQDTRAAEQAGTMPHGDLPIPSVAPSHAPAVDRATMKKDTAAYTKSKQPTWMPNDGAYHQGNTMKSVADRATVKAATKDAEKNQSIPRGQAAQPTTSAQ